MNNDSITEEETETSTDLEHNIDHYEENDGVVDNNTEDEVMNSIDLFAGTTISSEG